MINWLLNKLGFVGNIDVDPVALVELESDQSISFSAKLDRETGRTEGYASDDQPFDYDAFASFVQTQVSAGSIGADEAATLLQDAENCIFELGLPESLAITNMLMQQLRANENTLEGSGRISRW